MTSRFTVLLAGLVLVGHVLGHSAAHAAEAPFPEGATTPTAQEIHQRLAGKVFSLPMPDGAMLRLEYSARGHYFLDGPQIPAGYPAVGHWRTEDGKLCRSISVGADQCTNKMCRNMPVAPEACVDVRVSNDLLQIRRWDGQVASFIPK